MDILTDYNFPVIDQTKPAFAIQKQTTAMMVTYPRSYVLNDLGTGKTRCALWAYDYLRKQGLVKKMLVICPLSTMNRVWEREISMEFTDITCAVLYGTKEKRLAKLARKVDVYIINHDGLNTIYSELLAHADIDVVLIDELATYRNGGTQRTKFAKAFAHNKRYVWGLTGSPMPREVTDVWGQCIVVTPNTVPKYFSHLRSTLMTRVSTFKWVPRPGAEVMAVNYMKPSVRFTLDEVTELPPKVMRYYEVDLSPEQKRIYEGMRNWATVQINNKQITAANAGVVLQKLLQIASGYVYSNDGKTSILDNTDRLQMTLDLIDSTLHKVIVFVAYKSGINGLQRMFLDNKIDCGIVHGDVSKTQRDKIFHLFQDTSKFKVLLAHPVCMSHGLTLTSAATIIWFSPTLSLDTFFQANGRITRIGQNKHQLIAMLGGTSVERRVYQILANNERLQQNFLDIIADETQRKQMAAE